MVLPNGALLFSLLSLLHPLTIPASPSSGLAGLAGLAGVAGLAGPKFAAKAAIKAALVKKKILLVGAAAGVPSAKAVVGAGAVALGLKKKKKVVGSDKEMCEVVDEEVWTPQCHATFTQECKQTSRRECRTDYTEQCETEHQQVCQVEHKEECVTDQVEQCWTEHTEECWEEQEQVCDVWEHCEEEEWLKPREKRYTVEDKEAVQTAYIDEELDKLPTEELMAVAKELTEDDEIEEGTKALETTSGLKRKKRSLHLLNKLAIGATAATAGLVPALGVGVIGAKLIGAKTAVSLGAKKAVGAKLFGLGGKYSSSGSGTGGIGGKCEQMEKCHWRPAKVCKQVPEKKCHYKPQETCTKIPHEKCWQEPKERCWEVPHEQCWDEPEEECWEVPHEECTKVKAVVRKKWCKQIKGQKRTPVAIGGKILGRLQDKAESLRGTASAVIGAFSK